MPSPRTSFSPRGFTLTELLVTVAIVGILSVLVVALVGRGHDAANASRCLSNLRSLQMANIMYAADHHGQYVPDFVNSSASPVSSSSQTKWHNNRAFVTMLGVNPAATASVPSALLCPLHGSYSGSNGYGYNFTGLSGGTDTPGWVRGVRQTDIVRPAETLAFADSLDWQINSSHADKYAGSETATTQAIAYRHDNSACIAYWDGHVARLPRSQVVGNTKLWKMLE